MNIRKHSCATAAIFCLLSAIVAVGCGASTAATDKLAMSDGPSAGAGNAVTPASVRAHKGHNVEITVTNTGDKTHGFTVDGYNISQTVDAGKTTVIHFKADHTGTFRVWCQLHPTHKDAQLTIS
jgi:heme/copper-type cytochrome/quinol oxidase subunit 2